LQKSSEVSRQKLELEFMHRSTACFHLRKPEFRYANHRCAVVLHPEDATRVSAVEIFSQFVLDEAVQYIRCLE
jgi:hypothetical protein